MAHRFSGPGQPYEGLTRLTKGGPRWTGKIMLVPEKLAEPLKWKKPRLVFVNSMSDLFHEDVPNEYIAAVFGVMAATPRHTYQILTKRAERLPEWFAWYEGTSGAGSTAYAAMAQAKFHHLINHRDLDTAIAVARNVGGIWPLPNVHLGVSVEDQKHAEERIPHLLATPAAVRWVSCEPLLSDLDLTMWLTLDVDGEKFGSRGNLPSLDWVVVGGESGNKARPMSDDWVRAIRDQCVEAGVPFFFKQKIVDRKKVGLPILDGRQWQEFPHG